MFNKKKAIKNNQNDPKTNAKLWQAVSEEEQNALKGGWPLPWPFGGGGGYVGSNNHNQGLR